ncbi:jacalin-like lectin [Paenibacillus montaniterrae]|nr:jacalin-like lectin [Paenibacillus montaniterrae]
MYKSMYKALLIGLALLMVASYVPQGEKGKAYANSATGSFNILSYNVGGLPWGLSSSDPASNTPLISPKLNAYDIVNVQEDFNYHAALYANANHAYKTATSGGAGIGSGLNTLSIFPMTNLKRITWNDRYGLIDNGSDQLTPKGFTATRHRLAEGVFIDVYNLHADAGTDSGSMAARASNIRQLYNYIVQHSEGNAVIVFGDTNTRYTREKPLLDEMLSATGLTDAWVELVRGGVAPQLGDALIDQNNLNSPNHEVVDKIFYRGSAFVDLQATQYRLEDTYFTDSNGAQLSDHYAISAVFSYTLSDQLSLSDPFGGSGGDAFNQLNHVLERKISSLTLQSGARVDGFSLGFADGSTLSVGGTANASVLQLDADEYIASVTLNRAVRNGDHRIFYMQVTTSKNKQISGGTATADTVTYTAPAGWYIAGFHGRAGAELDSLGVIYKRL